jgi:O-antigen/teichoic acid export membrane protein
MSAPEDAGSDRSISAATLAAPVRERLVTGSLYSFTANVVGKVLATIGSIIYARLLGPEDLGVFLIYLQIAGLGIALAGLGLGTTITKFVAQFRVQDRSKLGEVLSTIVTVTLVSAMIVSLAVFILADAVGRGLYRNETLVVMIRLFSVFLGINVLSSVSSSILLGFQSFRKLSLIGISLEAMGIPIAIFSLLTFGLLGAAIGGVLVATIGFMLIVWSTVRTWRKEGIRLRIAFHRDAAQVLLRYTGPLLISTVVLRTVLLYRSSFLALTLGFGDAGLFKAASTLYGIVLLVPGAISVPLLPVASELYAASPLRAKESLTKLIRITSYLGVAVSLAVGVAAGPLVWLLFGTDFAGAAPLVFVLAIAGFMETLGSVGSHAVLGEGRTSMLLKVDLVLALAIVVTTTFFVPLFGLMGVGYSALVASTVYSSVLVAKLSVDGRISLAPLGKTLLLVAGGFLLAAIGVAIGNAQGNLWVGGAIVVAYVVAAWALMDRRDRTELADIARSIFRGVRR